MRSLYRKRSWRDTRAGLLSWRRNRHARSRAGPTLIPQATQATMDVISLEGNSPETRRSDISDNSIEGRPIFRSNKTTGLAEHNYFELSF